MTAILAGAAAGLILFTLVKEVVPAWSGVMRLALTALVVLAVLPTVQTLVSFAAEAANAAGAGEWLTPLTQVLGVAIVSGLLAESARDAGASGLASGVELAGKAALLLLVLPVLRALFALIGGT
ncbi:MAG: hypothetical protein IK104_09335 [Clostridia bacterium]|nr:hypothetical protein [Clostridia bacterium]